MLVLDKTTHSIHCRIEFGAVTRKYNLQDSCPQGRICVNTGFRCMEGCENSCGPFCEIRAPMFSFMERPRRREDHDVKQCMPGSSVPGRSEKKASADEVTAWNRAGFFTSHPYGFACLNSVLLPSMQFLFIHYNASQHRAWTCVYLPICMGAGHGAHC